jgi:hypothetical protein
MECVTIYSKIIFTFIIHNTTKIGVCPDYFKSFKCAEARSKAYYIFLVIVSKSLVSNIPSNTFTILMVIVIESTFQEFFFTKNNQMVDNYTINSQSKDDEIHGM